MGFHVDMAELLSHLETLSSDIKSTQSDLLSAKTATNRIISSQALYGHAGQAVYHQLNNYDAALHVSLSDNLMLLSGEFSRTLSAFQSQVKETSATAILDEAYLHQLSQTLVQHQEKHASIECSIASIYGDIADLVSLSSPKSSYDECTDKANRVLTHTIEWVSAFDGASTSSQTQALLERDEVILSSLQGLGSLSYTDSRYSQFVSDAHFAKYVKQIDKQIQAKIKAAKQAQEKAAKVKELAWKKHHPVQSFIHDLEAGAIGWLDKDIKAHPNPLNRASAGFLKGAVELVSGLAEGGVNLTQVGLEELEVFGDMLQGNKPSQWKMADISGMLETEKQLARLALGTVTSNVFFDASIVLDGLPQRGIVGSIQKELRLDRQMSENFWQETSKSIAEAFKEDPAQATGRAVFEVGLLLFPWAKSGKLGETTKGAEMLNDVDKLSDGANLLQRLSKSTGFGDDLTAANQLKTFNQGLKEFSQAAKASLSKEALEDLGENLRNLTFQVPSQELALESAGTTGKIKSVGEFLDNAKVNVQRFSTSTSDDVAKVSGKLDEVGNVESKVGSAADEGTKIIEKLKREVPVGQQIEKGLYGRKQLLPEVKFTTENGYKYETDNLRRIESVEVNELKLKHGTRNQYSQRMVGGLDRLPDDDGGHLIATMFNGSGDIDNLVAMNKDINRNGGVWYEIEQEWKNALQEIPPKKVSVSIEPIYKGESLRPIQFEVNYSIEGQRSVEITIKNKPGG
ncbi:DNA/RNA non-specific endonuclease [Streptococcus orisratti]